MTQKYYARICWNLNGWVFPSRSAQKLETDSWVSKSGFGHEEWLFNFAWMIRGYHHAFLQPVNKSFERVTGKTIHILLYTVSPDRKKLYVGEIQNCEVLSRSQAAEVLRHYRKSGWLKSMKEQISDIGADSTGLESHAELLFNVRFRREDVQFYDPMPIAKSNDFIMRLKRYTLAEANEQHVKTQWTRRVGTMVAPKVRLVTRAAQPATVVDPIHASLQARLFELLKSRFGANCVSLEENFVDVTIKRGKRKVLVEIKSDPDARVAIRKALGQIMEYAYFDPELRNEDAGLVVVAPGLLTQPVIYYLDRLRKKFGFSVKYCSFSLDDQLPSVFG
jgi:hypothetical protein